MPERSLPAIVVASSLSRIELDQGTAHCGHSDDQGEAVATIGNIRAVSRMACCFFSVPGQPFHNADKTAVRGRLCGRSAGVTRETNARERERRRHAATPLPMRCTPSSGVVRNSEFSRLISSGVKAQHDVAFARNRKIRYTTALATPSARPRASLSTNVSQSLAHEE